MKRNLIKWLICQFLIVLVFAGPVWAAKKSVLVIESYHSGYAWDASYKKGIESVLGKNYKISYFQMDTKRVPSSEFGKMADKAWQTYQRLNPDLVMLGDDNALKFLGTRFIKTKIPVVYLGINNNPRAYLGKQFREITGVMEKPLLKRTIPIIRHIVGTDLKKVLILFDSGTTSKVSLTHVFKNKSNVNLEGINVDLKFISKLDDWKKTVKSAKKDGYGAIIIGLYHTITDSKGKHVKAGDVMAWTSKNTPVPPFGFWDFSVGKDMTTGGFVLFGESQGVAAAKIAQRILEKGTSPKKIYPVIGDRGRYLFSRSKLKKYGLNLPSDIASKADFVD